MLKNKEMLVALENQTHSNVENTKRIHKNEESG